MAPSHASASVRGSAKHWTGVRTGQPLSREIIVFGVPTLSKPAEGNIGGSVIASCRRTLRGQRTCACTESPCARTGRSHARLSG
jgi:hypothetical protein